jgi:uncharacterized membrane protein
MALFGLRFLVVLIVFLAIDIVWLKWIAHQFYRENLGHLLAATIVWPAAVVFYLIFVLGLLIFVLQPALQQNSVLHAFAYGALFGAVAYATYDLTNLATLKDWPVKVVIVDLLWGAFLSGTTCGVSFLILTGGEKLRVS